MSKNSIFERDLAGEIISLEDPDYPLISDRIEEAQKTLAELNSGYHDPATVRALFSTLIGKAVDDSFSLLPPFYTDYGKNIQIGKNVFINHACEFMDRGGITIGNNVLFAPKVNLITINHPLDPLQRRATYCKPIVIEDNVWIGVGASVMPGVTIGTNSVVAANSVVTKDVPPNTVVGGIPARFIRSIEEK